MIDIEDMKFGCIPSPDDNRDYHISGAIPITPELPQEYIIPEFHTAIYNQLDSSECVAFSLRWLCEWMNKRELKKLYELSEKFIFGNRYPSQLSSRFMSFEGMIMREALDCLIQDGTCENGLMKVQGNEWYDYNNAITPTIRENARKFKIRSYARINSDLELKNTLVKVGAVAASIPITNLYGKSIHPLLTKEYADKNAFSNHAIVIVGYKLINKKEYWICINSYGKEFGDNGLFYYEIGSYFREIWSVIDDTTLLDKQKFYHVQLCACRDKNNTKPYIDKLIKLGLKYYVPNINGLWKVQVYALSNKERAEQERDKLRKLGFKDAFVTYY